jgi:hypothetical protein
MALSIKGCSRYTYNGKDQTVSATPTAGGGAQALGYLGPNLSSWSSAPATATATTCSVSR